MEYFRFSLDYLAFIENISDFDVASQLYTKQFLFFFVKGGKEIVGTASKL